MSWPDAYDRCVMLGLAYPRRHVLNKELDPKRISVIIRTILKVWKQVPDQTLGKLLEHIVLFHTDCRSGRPLRDTNDVQLLKALRSYAKFRQEEKATRETKKQEKSLGKPTRFKIRIPSNSI